MNNKVVKFIYHGEQSAYAIQDGRTQLYFVWCYNDEHYANLLAERLRIENAIDQQMNWRSQLPMLHLSLRTHD